VLYEHDRVNPLELCCAGHGRPSILAIDQDGDVVDRAIVKIYNLCELKKFAPGVARYAYGPISLCSKTVDTLMALKQPWQVSYVVGLEVCGEVAAGAGLGGVAGGARKVCWEVLHVRGGVCTGRGSGTGKRRRVPGSAGVCGVQGCVDEYETGWPWFDKGYEFGLMSVFPRVPQVNRRRGAAMVSQWRGTRKRGLRVSGPMFYLRYW
jgi:hypothetical protein